MLSANSVVIFRASLAYIGLHPWLVAQSKKNVYQSIHFVCGCVHMVGQIGSTHLEVLAPGSWSIFLHCWQKSPTRLVIRYAFYQFNKKCHDIAGFKISQCFQNILLLHQWHLRFDQLIILCIKRAQGGAFAGASPSPVIFWIGWKTNGVLPRIQQ